MQKVIISGNLGKDAEVKQLEGNRYHTFFSVAVNYKKGKGEDMKQLTQWYSVAYFSNSNKVAEYLKKGAKVIVCGNLELDIFKSDKSQQTFVNANVLAQDIEIVEFVEMEAEKSAESLPPIPDEEPAFLNS
jgi:single stranded DNA-binding protein